MRKRRKKEDGNRLKRGKEERREVGREREGRNK